MKIINFGSLNIDQVHQVDDFVNSGETIFAKDFQIFPGGKGLNQSIAAARAGANVLHAGYVGTDGQFLLDVLSKAGVDVSLMRRIDAPNGHAVIEVNHNGQNRIIVYGGTNQMLTENYIDEILSYSEPGDIVLLQNESNLVDLILIKAHEKGLRIAFNPSPMPMHPEKLHLEYVDWLLVNEIEAAQLAQLDSSSSFDSVLVKLAQKYPGAAIVMTLGKKGVLLWQDGQVWKHPIFKVTAQDTTAAGDTFSGYFLSAVCKERDPITALREASAASAIAVSRLGAACSIPTRKEVEEFLKENTQ